LAAALRKEPGVDQVELVDGRPGELSVWVDGKVVAKKGFLFTPSVEKMRNAVRKAIPAGVS
jgi:hypothetical protein